MGGKLRGAKLGLLLLCFLAFVLYAMYFNSFGPNAQAVMAYFQIDEARNGMILSVQSTGCLALAVLLGLFGERINKINGIALGLGVMGISCAGIGLLPAMRGGYGMMLSLSLLAGIGYIMIDLLMNSVVADVFPERKNSLLPYVHAFYGGGAMLAPLFVTALVNPAQPQSFARPCLCIGIVSLGACAAYYLCGKAVLPQTPYADMRAMRSRAGGNPAEIFTDKRAWLLLGACFLYLNFQVGMTAWLPTYCSEVLGYSFQAAGRMVTLYFLGALLMRFLSPYIYKKLGVRHFHRISLLASAAVFVLFLFLPLPGFAAALLIALMGLLQGASVPSLVILCCDAFPTRTASASSLIIFGVSLSSMITPTVMGALMKSAGHLPSMLLITLCLVVSVFLLPMESRG